MSGFLAIEDVRVRFGGLDALAGVSFTVEPGTIVGLIGPNGSGKTTLMNVVSGVLRPTGGAVRFKGRANGFLCCAEIQVSYKYFFHELFLRL